MKYFIIVLISSFLTASCGNTDLHTGEKSITVPDLENYVRNLGSDEFMGRKPFTPGEKITIDYLAAEL
jgi:hypothetical protein